MVYFVLLSAVGLAIGSFLGALTWRLARGGSITRGFSRCPYCRREIAWFDNLPLLSYLLLGGRCRWCQRKISLRYPLIEASTLALFLLVAWSFSRGDGRVSGVMGEYQGWLGVFALPYFLFIVSILLAILVIDWERKVIPDSLVLLGSLVTLIALLASPSPTLFVHLAWGTFAALFFFAVHLVTLGRGMGLGDVKLGLLVGLVTGFPGTVVSLWLSFLIGAALGLVLVLVGRAKFGRPIPFGPFLVAGTLVALVLPIRWYLL